MGIVYIDTHCHLDEFENIPSLLDLCKKSQIEQILIPGISPEKVSRTQKVISENSNYPLYGALGFHPWFLKEEFLTYKEFPKNFVAIGEIGLDKNIENKDLQLRTFKHGINLAEHFKKFMIIHCVGCLEEAFEILKNTSVPFILHSYGGSEEITTKYLTLSNCYFSFNGYLLSSKKLQKSLKKIPRNRILFETDAPDQYFKEAKVKQAGARQNTPLNLPQIVDFASIMLEDHLIAKQVKINFEELINYARMA